MKWADIAAQELHSVKFNYYIHQIKFSVSEPWYYVKSWSVSYDEFENRTEQILRGVWLWFWNLKTPDKVRCPWRFGSSSSSGQGVIFCHVPQTFRYVSEFYGY
jgi:hypothetical protein